MQHASNGKRAIEPRQGRVTVLLMTLVYRTFNIAHSWPPYDSSRKQIKEGMCCEIWSPVLFHSLFVVGTRC